MATKTKTRLLINMAVLSWAAFLLASCASTGTINPCDILRKPPTLKPPTRTAIFADKPVARWYVAIDEDGRKAGCW